MKKLVLFILFGFLLCACDSTVQDSKEAETRITYFKDNRTGICFAQVISTTYANYTVTSITAVDCEKVKNFVDK